MVIVITGASAGIGKKTAIDLAQKGHKVYTLARRINLMEELKAFGILPIAVDITSKEQIQSAIDTILSQEKTIDVLINNAGYGFYSALEEDNIQQVKDMFDVNVFGLVEMTKAVLPTMRIQNSGTIINISSVVGKVAFPYMGWYSASKHAVEGLSDALRLELAPFNIKVVVIEPGRVESEFGKVAFEKSNIDVDSPYKDKKIDFQNLVDTNPIPSDKASSISHTVIKIVNSKNPKTRYVPNLDGKLAIFFKKWCGDKFIDNVIKFKL